MTHAFNYGTGVYEGIRGYWNAPKDQMFILKMREHYERLLRCAKTMKIKVKQSLDELEQITLEVAKRNAYQAYIISGIAGILMTSVYSLLPLVNIWTSQRASEWGFLLGGEFRKHPCRSVPR